MTETEIVNRIAYFKNLRGWSINQLAEKSGVSASAISFMFKNSRCPSIPILENLCRGMRIDISQLFANPDENIVLTNSQEEYLKSWNSLSEDQKNMVLSLVTSIIKNSAK